MTSNAIPGYARATAAPSPLTLADLDLLKQAVLLGEADLAALRQSADVLRDQVEDILDVWYGFVGSHPHLVHYFSSPATGQPIGDYLAAVRRRFVQWILDTAEAQYDQQWLNWQYEIGKRHHRSGKNQVDSVAAVPNVAFRYLPAFIYPITATLKPFLAKKGHSPAEVEAMHQAWVKSVTLQVCLWSQPYVTEGDY